MALIKCPECNNEISDRAETCPHCGIKVCDFVNLKTELNDIDITNDTLILTTEKEKRNPMFWVGYIVFAIVMVFTYFFLINWLLGYFFGVVSSIAIFILALYTENQILLQDKSYVKIYDKHIEGVTFKSQDCEGGVNFSILYSEILKVDTTQGFVIIQTKYNKYKVQAIKKEVECKDTICKKIVNI